MPSSNPIEVAAKAGYEWVKSNRPLLYGPYEEWEELEEDYREYLRGIHKAGLDAVTEAHPKYDTLGSIANEIRRMKADGMTRESIDYVLNRVYGE